MPTLTPATVNTARTLVIWASRTMATVLLFWGGYLFLKKLLFAIGYGGGGLFHMFRVFNDIGEQQSTYRGLAALLVGTVLAIGARRIARWIVSMPETGCPACGYRGAVTSTCPECGLQNLAAEDRAA